MRGIPNRQLYSRILSYRMPDQVDSTSMQFDMRQLSSNDSGASLSNNGRVVVERYVDKADEPVLSLIHRIRSLLEMIRFSHTIFALPFALLSVAWAVSIDDSAASLSSSTWVVRIVGVLLCMVFARSAAMTFNRIVDRDIDAKNQRTENRHLPSGTISLQAAWTFLAFNVCGFMGSCLLFLPNWLPLVSAIPVLGWICGYSFAKRFTSLAHLWLGVALALTPICAWVAIRGEIVQLHPSDLLPTVGLALAIVLWVTGFDIIYACQDAEVDSKLGLNSIPARFGVRSALRIAAGLHGAMLLVLLVLPFCFPQLSLGLIYFSAWFVVAILLATQHRLVSEDDLLRVNLAFFHLNAMISVGLSVAAAVDSFLR